MLDRTREMHVNLCDAFVSVDKGKARHVWIMRKTPRTSCDLTAFLCHHNAVPEVSFSNAVDVFPILVLNLQQLFLY